MNPQTPPHTTLPFSWSWADVIDRLVEQRGSLAELARHLQDVVPHSVGLSCDPMTVERGLRRLRQRGQREGNRYGRLIVRYIGLPSPIETWAQDMGLYHSHSSDLPVQHKRAQLLCWDCPPISESRAAIWVHIGLASVAHQLQDTPHRDHRIQLALILSKHASTKAQTELALFRALVAHNQGSPDTATTHLNHAESLITQLNDPEHSACFRARLIDQRAYLCARNWRAHPETLHQASQLLHSIPTDNAPPFAAFRRAHSIAWCLWRQGHHDAAQHSALLASQHAGDGGLIRFRIAALGLLAHIQGPNDPNTLPTLQRAQNMAARLGDQRLFQRMQHFIQRMHHAPSAVLPV